jgi:hypothetical protein
MDSSTPGVHPQEVLKTELVAYCGMKNTDGSRDECPASAADLSTGTACPNGVIVCHVDIKYELALEWIECFGSNCFLVPWLMGTPVRLVDGKAVLCCAPLRCIQDQFRND